MKLTYPIKVWNEQSVSATLSAIIHSDTTHFQVVNSAEKADVVIFENDTPSYIRRTKEYKQYPEKCVVIGEFDEPTYFLPACYASNKSGVLSHKRIKTIPYFLSQRKVPNAFVDHSVSEEPKKFLYSFMGGSTSWVRKKLFKLKVPASDVRIKETNNYQHWNYESDYVNRKELSQRQYADMLAQSAFFLCPRGAGISSIRLFEVMKAGRVPVIIADNWVPVDEIPWDEFSITVAESDLPRLDEIIRARKDDAAAMGLKAREAWEKYCHPDVHSKILAKFIQEIQAERNKRKELLLHSIFPVLEATSYLKANLRAQLKMMILYAFDVTGFKFQYSLNRPIEEQLGKENAPAKAKTWHLKTGNLEAKQA
ncbi:glycosyltransferase family 47 protein [Dyadobacter sp. CY327]|uniref:exostosin domain-containing protein n=1 Tax=Dyadobacter sp. CY327 TaxID=2907301 RepID=UPI001F4869DB|nr:exostosin family protein [Dyadobacter sp. CY327]MCE7071029.1 glycosyltransferase family 47 protein [Dyadobacter sp. CY327]